MGDTEGASRLLEELNLPEFEDKLSPQFVSLRLVKSLLDASMWKRAASECKAYIKAFGEDSAVHSLYGEAHRNLGNVNAALNHFFLAAKMSPQDPAPYYGLLLVYFACGDWRAIRGILPRAAERGCDEKTVSLYSILCAARLDPDSKALLPVAQNAVIELGPVPSLLLALAVTCLKAGMPSPAAMWFKKALEMEVAAPLSAHERDEATRGLFSALAALGDGDALIEAYRMCDGRYGLSDEARSDFIKLLSKKKLWAEAAAQMELSLRHGGNDDGVRQLAMLYRNAGMYRQAAILYRKLLRASPRDRRLLSNLVLCLDRMGEKAAALKLVHEANRALAPDANLLLIEARLCTSCGKSEKALEALRKAADIFSNDPRVFEEIAAIYRARKSELAAIYEERARALKERRV